MKRAAVAEERFDVLTEAGRPTGRTLARSEVHRTGAWHASFHAFVVFRDREGIPTGLFQLRSMRKKSFPGKIDSTVTGHLSAGERVADGVREIQEEIGLEVAFDRLVPLGQRRWVGIDRDAGRDDREIHHLFLLPLPAPPDALTPQASEVDALLGVDLRDGARWANGEIDRLPYRIWAESPHAASDGPLTRDHLTLENFVAVSDRYFQRIVLAGLDYLEGRLEDPTIYSLEDA